MNNHFVHNPVFCLSNNPSKALIIDDEQDIYILIRNIFKQRNIETLHAESINEASKILINNKEIDIVFLDNHLPNGFGIQYIKEFKDIRKIFLIMITAYDTNYIKKMAKINGAYGLLGKPFAKKDILNILDNIQTCQ